MKKLQPSTFLIKSKECKEWFYDYRYETIILDRCNICLKLNHKQFWRGATVIQKMVERKRL